LRQALPHTDAFLRIEKQTLRWQPSHTDVSWTFDVLDFERAVAQAAQAKNSTAVRGALEETVSLYRGDLLPSCYDEWILPERERLRQAFLEALE
jgi:two-component SAPR family response regulator